MLNCSKLEVYCWKFMLHKRLKFSFHLAISLIAFASLVTQSFHSYLRWRSVLLLFHVRERGDMKCNCSFLSQFLWLSVLHIAFAVLCWHYSLCIICINSNCVLALNSKKMMLENFSFLFMVKFFIWHFIIFYTLLESFHMFFILINFITYIWTFLCFIFSLKDVFIYFKKSKIFIN